ncbi:hypothetical protein RchiOBHm_Chr6g0306991 [Rosa chinensis]|uniref:Uncharacterized protein n=1 Tax=Rosa chinensis TaxID=74649 RepID=A0A2P6Q088_ROSCH|nr:hypothetical protein RchiOBHm_Chr6g0306991 [Rosa chinensis]
MNPNNTSFDYIHSLVYQEPFLSCNLSKNKFMYFKFHDWPLMSSTGRCFL